MSSATLTEHFPEPDSQPARELSVDDRVAEHLADLIALQTRGQIEPLSVTKPKNVIALPEIDRRAATWAINAGLTPIDKANKNLVEPGNNPNLPPQQTAEVRHIRH